VPPRDLCQLCDNKHPNPWHKTTNCPFRVPAFVEQKATCERVLQYNNIHGRINPDFNKALDTSASPLCSSSYPRPNIPVTANSATVTIDTTTNSIFGQDNQASEHLPDYCTEIFENAEGAHDEACYNAKDIINEKYIDTLVSPSANMGIGPRRTLHDDDDNSAFGDLIMDPLQFLSYQA
jgi:hypothetical protein